MNKEGCFWSKDQYLPITEAIIPLNDLGFSRGYGVYEYLRTYDKKPFMLESHIDRLLHSLEMLSLKLEYNEEKIKVIIENLIDKVDCKEEILLQIYATAGISKNDLIPEQDVANLYILAKPGNWLPKQMYVDGVKAITIKGNRFLPKCKYLNHLPGLVHLSKAHRTDIQEVLYVNENEEILESVTANFFGFQNDKLITANEGVLHGITRGLVLELAKTDFSIEQRPIEYSELPSFNEAFVTSTTKEILPIKSIDHITFEEGLGPRTKRLMQLFYEHTRQLKS